MEAPSASGDPTRRRHVAGRAGGLVMALALAAALLLTAAEMSTIASVDVPGESCEVTYDQAPDLADRCALGGFERHGGALLLLAALAGLMGVMALRGAPTAAGAVLTALGVAVLAIALIGDLPLTNETGAIGDDLDDATAQAGLGFYVELTAGLLALIAGALALLASRTP